MGVLFSKRISKAVAHNKIPKEVWIDFRDAFESFSRNRNFRLYDIKKLVNKGPHVYYRLRVRNYRALFHMDDENVIVEDIGSRGGIYKS
jgi:mRNA-degrading endonuclease RelE of RelBE toxin-antitoxin system